jgi:hypothetical protein
MSINQIVDRSRNSLDADSLTFNTNDVVEIVAPDSSRVVDSDTVEFDESELVDGQGTAELLVVMEVFDAGADSAFDAGTDAAIITPVDSTSESSEHTYPVVATLELIEPFSSRILVDTVLTQPMHSRDSTQPAESAPYQDITDSSEPVQLRFAGLPPTTSETSARLTIFIDLNGDGEWSFTTNPAEPRRVVSSIQLLNDFEGTIEVSFSRP